MKDEIIRMARKAGFEKVVAIDPDGSKTVTVAPIPELLAFANLVAAAEREAILDLVDGYAKNNTDLAEAIRARGTT